jgi:predicted RNA-binding Zn ribbon-like protein
MVMQLCKMAREMPPIRQKSPFEFTGGNPCLDFADTMNGRTEEHPEELLTAYDRLVQWSEEAGVISARVADRLRRAASEAPGKALTTLRNSIQLRDAIYDIFSAVALRGVIPDTALAILNKAARQAWQHSQLTYGHRRFSWEWIEPEGNLDAMLWPVSRAATQLLSSEEVSYVKQCAAETCSWLFLDQTKNHRRRWCDMRTCGNRNTARRYYRRQRAQ